jgi:hypothetical protein
MRISMTIIALLLSATAAEAQSNYFPLGSMPPLAPVRTYQPPIYQPMPVPQPRENWIGNNIGDSTIWNSNRGGSVTCQRVGNFTYCN